MDRVFPDIQWARLAPDEAGFSAVRLADVKRWLLEFADGLPFRLVITRHGYLLAEWSHGIDLDAKIRFRLVDCCFQVKSRRSTAWPISSPNSQTQT